MRVSSLIPPWRQDVLLLLLLAASADSEPWCRLAGFQSHGRPTLGGSAPGQRVHFNQMEYYPNYASQGYYGPVTCFGPAGTPPPGVDPFPGGIHENYDSLAWPPLDQLDALEQLVPSTQMFPATLEDGRRITTRLEFVPEGYYLTRFLPQEGADPDTSYLDAQVFHTYPTMPVLWIEGVSQVEGIVGQAITIVSEDSLFITGDLIVSGTRLSPCSAEDTFGMTPEGTEILIGLIGYSDVIVAATLENGAVNGEQQPGTMPCGLDHSPVVTQCGQGRKDVIITASIMALENRFQAEFWITSVSPYPPESPVEYMLCGEDPGPVPYGFPGCITNTGTNDRRGTVWFCGSLAQDCGGRFQRNPPPGTATIGFATRQMRYDPNLQVSAPPYWPELEWLDEDPPAVELSEVAQALCGRVLVGEEFLQPFVDGDIALQLTAHPQSLGGREELRITAWLDGLPVETRLDTLVTGSSLNYRPGFDLPLEETHELYFTVEWDAQIWNPGGTQCRWIFELEDVDPPVIALSPDLEAGCGQEVDWFDFHSRWTSGDIYLDVSASPQAAGGFETFRLETWINGQCTDSSDVVVEAGEGFRYVPPVLQDRQDEIRSLHVSARWDYQSWNTGGALCRLEFPDPDPPTLTLSPTAESLCGLATEWTPFLAHLESGALWMDFQAHPLAQGGQELVSLLTYTDQGLVDSLSGPVPAGETVRLYPNLSTLPDPEPLVVYLVIRWDAEAWNTNGSDCLWSIGTVDVDPRPDEQPGSLALRIAPNPANPTFTVEVDLPAAGETRLVLYDIRGRRVQTLLEGWQPAGVQQLRVDPGPGASGLLFLDLESPAGRVAQKVLVVK